MKLLSLVLVGLSCLLCRYAVAEATPRGTVLELHSCELYAGGCIVSSEATLGGRYMLRAWNFSGGSFNGTDLTGLSVAALQSSADNLAEPNTNPGDTVVYLPARADAAQRAALVSWLTTSQPELAKATRLQTREVAIEFATKQTGYKLTAGDYLSVSTAPLESCQTGACGEALWYTPRAHTSVFTVAADRSSKVREPLLQLKWDDSGRRTVFLGKFGQQTPTQNLFVSSPELCGLGKSLF
jgi:hypothetical protein